MRQEEAASHHLSQEPRGWQEAVLSCPGPGSHLRAEPKARIKGPWGQSTSIHSSPEVLTTLCCVCTGECPLGVGAGPFTEDDQTRERAGSRALGDVAHSIRERQAVEGQKEPGAGRKTGRMIGV